MERGLYACGFVGSQKSGSINQWMSSINTYTWLSHLWHKWHFFYLPISECSLLNNKLKKNVLQITSVWNSYSLWSPWIPHRQKRGSDFRGAEEFAGVEPFHGSSRPQGYFHKTKSVKARLVRSVKNSEPQDVFISGEVGQEVLSYSLQITFWFSPSPQERILVRRFFS